MKQPSKEMLIVRDFCSYDFQVCFIWEPALMQPSLGFRAVSRCVTYTKWRLLSCCGHLILCHLRSSVHFFWWNCFRWLEVTRCLWILAKRSYSPFYPFDFSLSLSPSLFWSRSDWITCCLIMRHSTYCGLSVFKMCISSFCGIMLKSSANTHLFSCNILKFCYTEKKELLNFGQFCRYTSSKTTS